MKKHTPGPIVGCEGIEAWFENGEANARLIASAPELLSALISLLSEAEAFATAIRPYANSEAIAAARAAIAKATGAA